MTMGAVTMAMNEATNTGTSSGAASLMPAPIATIEASIRTIRAPRLLAIMTM
jgi:hypothetical protein